MKRWATAGGPWLPLAALLAWGFWGLRDLAGSVPAYADVLELTWAVSWYQQALRLGHSPLLYPLAFYPAGWHVATFAAGPSVIAVMLPLDLLGGPAFAYNVAALLTFVVAYAGAYLLARRFLQWPAATLAAVLFAFCSFRWYALRGHLNILLASALLPWLAWSLERARHSRRRSWLVLAGAFWGMAVASTLYFAWIGGLVALAWALARRDGWPRRAEMLLIPLGVALTLSSPAIYLFLRASAASASTPFTLDTANYYGASLNSLPLPYLFHPWLGELARQVYRGPAREQGAFNLGALALLAALAGLPAAWRARRDWLPALLLLLIGILLALGLTLKWDNQSLSLPALRPLDAAIWAIGHAIKPATFPAAQPPAPFDAAIPLPGLLLSAVVPYLEQSRVFARYAMLATLSIALLAGLALQRARRLLPRLALAGLLLFEIIPPPLERLPFPPAEHPAFAWLRQHPGVIADVAALNRETLTLWVRGETVWATLLHGQPTVAGASSVWPAHTRFFNDWLIAHPHPFDAPDFAALLRAYGVRYLVFHMVGSGEAALMGEAAGNPAFRVVGQFAPPAAGGAYAYPIGIVELLPASGPAATLQ
jgi:hypothetical protein